MSIAEEKAAGFRKQRRIGRLGHADTQEEDQGGCERQKLSSKPVHPLFTLNTRVGSSCRIQFGETAHCGLLPVSFFVHLRW